MYSKSDVSLVGRVPHLSQEAGVQALPQTRSKLWPARRQNIPRQEHNRFIFYYLWKICKCIVDIPLYAVCWIRIRRVRKFFGVIRIRNYVYGSGSFLKEQKNLENLYFVLWLLSEFLSLKTDVNAPKVYSEQKNLRKMRFFIGVLKAIEGYRAGSIIQCMGRRIRIRAKISRIWKSDYMI